ncbi:MAG: WbuC family cupin fold metalloprotein [Pirellula sp.]|jgi:cupin fold WbuC family metalloprotein|nr:WbuC family cupin fold metalloprotein [Pirellula sp.]
MAAFKTITTVELGDLVDSARSSERRRSNINLHTSFDDPFQRLVVAMCEDSYVVPHRHNHPPKSELFVVLEGAIGIVSFNEDGSTSSLVKLGPNESQQICDIPAGVVHTVVSLTKDAVFLEAKLGPYTPMVEVDIPSWAPVPGSIESSEFVSELRQQFGL